MTRPTFTATIHDAATTPGELVIEMPDGYAGHHHVSFIRAAIPADAEDTAAAIPALTEALHAEGLTWAPGQESTDIAGPVELTFR